jgi:hypothetical protein
MVGIGNCPKCYGTERLIFARHFRQPIDCELCLSRNPVRWAEYQRKRNADIALANAATKEFVRKMVLELKLQKTETHEQTEMRRGYCYWYRGKATV